MSFISYLINGISLGSVYAIIALGYTMVYGIAKMLNFAHGDIIMVGGYAAFISMNSLGVNPILAVILSVVICTILGLVIERVAYRPLRNASSPLAVLITAIGVSYLLQNLALLMFGADTKSFTSVVTVPAVVLAGGKLTISGETIVTVLACMIIMIGLTLFINKTKAGQAMLAVSEDRGAAQLMGINVKWNDCPYLCNRFCTGSNRSGSAVFCLSFSDTVHRSHAWYQSIRSRCIWRYRIDSGSTDRRYFAWYY